MRLRTLVTSFILAALGCAPELVSAQQPGQLTRVAPTTGLADSSLFICSDSTKALTRACKFSDVQKRLAFKTFDSLVTSTLRATGAITVGSCVGCGGGVTYPLAATDGSAAAPSIAFANSTGTGLYRFNADTLGFATAGLLRATLSASGSGASFRASGAGNLVLGPGTGNGRAVTVQGTSATGVLTSYLQVDRTAVSALNGAIFQGAGTAAAPMFSVQNGGGGGLGMYSPTIDTVAFSSLSAYTLGISGGAAAHLTGGAGNMTIQAGTGASRRLTLQTTTSGSTATTFLRGNELQQSVFIDGTTANPGISFSGDTTTGLVRSGAGLPSALSIFVHGSRKATFVDNAADTLVRLFIMPIDVSNGTRLTLFDTTHANNPKARIDFSESGGAPKWTIATNVALGDSSLEFNYSSVSTSKMKPSGSWYVPAGSAALPSYSFIGDTLLGVYRIGTAGASDTLMIAANGINQMKIAPAGILRLPLLPAEGATKNAMCWDGTTFNVTQNAAATCTVSSARFKENIVPVDAAAAWKIVGKSQLHSSTYNERVGGRKAIGIIAEQADSADTRLASRDAKGIITSTNYEEVTSLLLTVVKDQQRQLAFQQKMIDSLGRMVDTLFWKRGSLCNGKACKSEPEIPVHLVVKKVKPMRSANIEVVRDTSTTYTFPRARVVKDSAGVVQVKLLPSREP